MPLTPNYSHAEPNYQPDHIDKLEADLSTLTQIARTLSGQEISTPQQQAAAQIFISNAAEVLPKALAALKSLNLQRAALLQKKIQKQRQLIQEKIT